MDAAGVRVDSQPDAAAVHAQPQGAVSAAVDDLDAGPAAACDAVHAYGQRTVVTRLVGDSQSDGFHGAAI